MKDLNFEAVIKIFDQVISNVGEDDFKKFIAHDPELKKRVDGKVEKILENRKKGRE